MSLLDYFLIKPVFHQHSPDNGRKVMIMRSDIVIIASGLLFLDRIVGGKHFDL